MVVGRNAGGPPHRRHDDRRKTMAGRRMIAEDSDEYVGRFISEMERLGANDVYYEYDMDSDDPMVRIEFDRSYGPFTAVFTTKLFYDPEDDVYVGWIVSMTRIYFVHVTDGRGVDVAMSKSSGSTPRGYSSNPSESARNAMLNADYMFDMVIDRMVSSM